MTKYNFKLDVIRALAILGVVAIHVWYPIYSRPDFLGGISWWLAYTINILSRVSVPFFLMISGALLLTRLAKQEIKDTLSRIIWRIGLPLIFWSIVYMVWDNFYYGRFTYFDQVIRLFFTGSVFHLYFLVILFGLYLFLPMFRTFYRSAKDSQKKYVIIVSLLIGLVIYGWQFFIYKDRNILNFLTLWVPYLGYFLAGPYLIHLAHDNQPRRWVKFVWLAAVISSIIFGYVNLFLLGQGIMTFWGIGGAEYATNWLSPNIIIMSLAGFYLIYRQREGGNKYYRLIVRSLAGNALGIYLVHMLIINILDKHFGLFLDLGHARLWWYGLSKNLLVLLLSWLFSAIARRTFIVKAIVGGA